MKHKIGAVGVAIVYIFAAVGPAHAHGPCECLSPETAAPGTLVRVNESYGGIRVLWNPNPTELNNPMLVGSRWTKFHKPGRRTLELARQDEPGPISFRVPKVPGGTYLVVIFDPTEGPDNHFTWETFIVGASAALPATGISVLPALLAAALIFSGLALHRRTLNRG